MSAEEYLAGRELTGENFARNPGAWRLSATLNWRAAMLVWSHYQSAKLAVATSANDAELVKKLWPDLLLGRTAAFLGGVALEALLKGIVVKADSDAVDHGLFYGHDLKKLAVLAQIDVDEEQARLLEHLTGAVTWWGRYPVTRWDSEKARARFTESIRTDEAGAIERSTIPGVFLDEDWPVLCSLVGAVVAKLGDTTGDLEA